MKILLDTHILLWWLMDDGRLSDRAREAISEAEALVSTVSLWEIEIKRSLGRLEVDIEALLQEITQTLGLELLDVRPTHVLSLSALPLWHRDPFDRMLVAQAARERIPLVTNDQAIRRYAVEVVW